jgi:hypothetical protein
MQQVSDYQLTLDARDARALRVILEWPGRQQILDP